MRKAQLPPLDSTALAELEQSQYNVHGAAVLRSYTAPSCVNCDHFDEPKELCLRWNVRPPARTIAISCGPGPNGWEPDIPF